MSQAKRNNQVTNKTTIVLKVIQDPGRIFCSYSKLEKLNPLLNGHLAAIKTFYASKEVKEFPKMLQRSNSDRDKNHRKSMLESTGNTSVS